MKPAHATLADYQQTRLLTGCLGHERRQRHVNISGAMARVKNLTLRQARCVQRLKKRGKQPKKRTKSAKKTTLPREEPVI
jgi:hypothetical protein